MKRIDPTIGSTEVYRFAPGDGIRDQQTGEYGTVLDVRLGGTTVAGATTAVVMVFLHKEGIKKEYNVVWDSSSGLTKVINALKTGPGSTIKKNYDRAAQILSGQKTSLKKSATEKAEQLFDKQFGIKGQQKPVDVPVQVQQVAAQSKPSTGPLLTPEESAKVAANISAIKKARLQAAGFSDELIEGVNGNSLQNIVNRNSSGRGFGSAGNYSANLNRSLEDVDWLFKNLVEDSSPKTLSADIDRFLTSGVPSKRVLRVLAQKRKEIFGDRFVSITRGFSDNKGNITHTIEDYLDVYKQQGVNNRDLADTLRRLTSTTGGINKQQARLISALLEEQHLIKARALDNSLKSRGKKGDPFAARTGNAQVLSATKRAVGLNRGIPSRKLRGTSIEEIARQSLGDEKFRPFDVLTNSIYNIIDSDNETLNSAEINEVANKQALRRHYGNISEDDFLAKWLGNPFEKERFPEQDALLNDLLSSTTSTPSIHASNFLDSDTPLRVSTRPGIQEAIDKVMSTGYDQPYWSKSKRGTAKAQIAENQKRINDLRAQIAKTPKLGAELQEEIQQLQTINGKYRSALAATVLDEYEKYPSGLIGKTYREGRNTVYITGARLTDDGVVITSAVPKFTENAVFSSSWGDTTPGKAVGDTFIDIKPSRFQKPSETLRVFNDIRGLRPGKTYNFSRENFADVRGEDLVELLGYSGKRANLGRFEQLKQQASIPTSLMGRLSEEDFHTELFIQFQEALRTSLPGQKGVASLSELEKSAMTRALDSLASIQNKAVRRVHKGIASSFEEAEFGSQIYLDRLVRANSNTLGESTGPSKYTIDEDILDEFKNLYLKGYDNLMAKYNLNPREFTKEIYRQRDKKSYILNLINSDDTEGFAFKVKRIEELKDEANLLRKKISAPLYGQETIYTQFRESGLNPNPANVRKALTRSLKEVEKQIRTLEARGIDNKLISLNRSTTHLDKLEAAIRPRISNYVKSFITVDEPERALEIEDSLTSSVLSYLNREADIANTRRMIDAVDEKLHYYDNLMGSTEGSADEELKAEYNELWAQYESLTEKLEGKMFRTRVEAKGLATGNRLTAMQSLLAESQPQDALKPRFPLYNQVEGKAVQNPVVLNMLKQRSAFMASLGQHQYAENDVFLDNANRPYSNFDVNGQNFRLILQKKDEGFEPLISNGRQNIRFDEFGNIDLGKMVEGKLTFERNLKELKDSPRAANIVGLVGDQTHMLGEENIPFIKVAGQDNNFVSLSGYEESGLTGARKMLGRALSNIGPDGVSKNVLGYDIENIPGSEAIGYIFGKKGDKRMTAYTQDFFESLERDEYLEQAPKLGASITEYAERGKSEAIDAAKKVFAAKNKQYGSKFRDYLETTDAFGDMMKEVKASFEGKGFTQDTLKAMEDAARNRIRMGILRQTGEEVYSEGELLGKFGREVLNNNLDSNTVVFNQNVKFDTAKLLAAMERSNWVLGPTVDDFAEAATRPIDLMLLSRIADPGHTDYGQEAVVSRMLGGNYHEQHLGEADYLHAEMAAQKFTSQIKAMAKSPEELLVESGFTKAGVIYDPLQKRAFQILGGTSDVESDIASLVVDGKNIIRSSKPHLLIQESDYGLGLKMPTRMMPIDKVYKQPQSIAEAIANSSNVAFQMNERVEDDARLLVRSVTTKPSTQSKLGKLEVFADLLEDFNVSEGLSQVSGLDIIESMKKRASDLRAVTAQSIDPDSPDLADFEFKKSLARQRAAELEKYIPDSEMAGVKKLAALKKLQGFSYDLKSLHMPAVRELMSTPGLTEDSKDMLVEDYFHEVFSNLPDKVITDDDYDGTPISVKDYLSRVDAARSHSAKSAVIGKYTPVRRPNFSEEEQLIANINRETTLRNEQKAAERMQVRQDNKSNFVESIKRATSEEAVMDAENNYTRSEAKAFEEAVKAGNYSPDFDIISPIRSQEYTAGKVAHLDKLASFNAQKIKDVKAVRLGNTIEGVTSKLTGFFSSTPGRIATAVAATAASSYLAYKALSKPDLGQSDLAKEEKTVPLKNVDTIVENDDVIERRLEQKRNLYIRAIGRTDGPVDSRILNQVVAETVSPYIKVEKADAKVTDNRQKIQGDWLKRVDFTSFGV